ncbi:MAG: M56 family metallopeptidase [Bacteroidota bacterium]|nr:M56 family metallopeptidase [Bacteroidota bacterium]
MDTLFIYLMKSVISLTVFYFAYSLFLQRDTHFSLIRVYLLFSVLFSLILPYINISIPVGETVLPGHILLDSINITSSYISEVLSTRAMLSRIIIIVYFIGVAFLLARFIVKLSQLLFIVYQNGISIYMDQKVVFVNNDIAPFSFFNLIFVSKKQEHLNEILIHEKAHVRQFHSIDIIVIELLCILQWFNPVVWMYKQSMQSVHEFLADREVILEKGDTLNYQKILFTQATGLAYNSIVNNFNKSLLKKRLIMMKKEESKKWAGLRVVLIVPVVAILLISFSGINANSFNFVNDFSPQIVNDTIKKVSENGVFTVVDEMPVFSRGGEQGLKKFIATNVKYPATSRKEGIQGKVYVQFNVDEKGNVVDVKESRTDAKKPDKKGKMIACKAPELTKEALRVISSLPKFSPGIQKGRAVKVSFTIPINFLLN